MKLTSKLIIIATALSLTATGVRAVDLLERYPTKLVADDTDPAHARSWEFNPNDIFQVSHFSMKVGDSFKVETGVADLGVGHCADGAVWAVLIPREQGTLTSSAASKPESIDHVWLRLHPAQINRLFAPDTVSADGNQAQAAAMRAIAGRKMTSSWQANGKAMIPSPKDFTVFADTKDGARRFFMVDTEKQTAEYVEAFNRQPSRQISPASLPPVVVKTWPEAGSQEVPPGVAEIKVTFSHVMRDKSWSWSTAWENSQPEGVDQIRYESDHRTCVWKVKLEPGKTYGYWLNSEKFLNFKDTNGMPAVPYLLTFHTKASDSAGSTLPRVNPATGLPEAGADRPTADKALSFKVNPGELHAAAETWAPIVAPGEKPDLQKIRDEIKTLMDQHRYEESLQRQIWYFNHALEYGEVGPVRTSFGIMNWAELGRRYPKAKQALIEIRDGETREFTEGRGYAELFSEVQSLNRELQADDATVALFKQIYKTDQKLARECYYYAEDLLIANGDYALLLDCLGDPQARLQSAQRGLEVQRQSQQRMAEIRSQHPLPKLPVGMAAPPDMGAMATNNFVSQMCKLVEILVATDHKTGAEKIRDQALAVVDDERLKSAVASAEAKIKK